MGPPKLPSAMHRFTSEFEMGSGGSSALWSSDKLVGISFRIFEKTLNIKSKNFNTLQKNNNKFSCIFKQMLNPFIGDISRFYYIVKPHGQLVLVSFTPHNASTPSLSTW